MLALVGVAVGAGVFFIVPATTTGGLILTVVVGGSAVVLGVLVGKTLTGIAKTALYVYATENAAPEYFEDMDFGRLGGDKETGGIGGRF